jgi:adenylylsulfate kinase
MIETKKRTVMRMISYRITAWLFTILWTYLFTGNIRSATGFATLLHILLSIDYYIHERIWLKVRWGLTTIMPPVSEQDNSTITITTK